MGRKKLILAAAIIFIANSLVILTEVTVNKVLCCKSYGTRDVELAIFGFDCSCNHLLPHGHYKKNHSHWGSNCQCEEETQMQKRQYFCLDIPLIGSWLYRDIQVINYDFSLKTITKINTNSKTDLNKFFGNLFELIPVSKFLHSESILFQKMTLLC